jgi:hypothetical protein
MLQDCDHKIISITSKTWVNENPNENFPTKSTEVMDNDSYCFMQANRVQMALDRANKMQEYLNMH